MLINIQGTDERADGLNTEFIWQPGRMKWDCGVGMKDWLRTTALPNLFHFQRCPKRWGWRISCVTERSTSEKDISRTAGCRGEVDRSIPDIPPHSRVPGRHTIQLCCVTQEPQFTLRTKLYSQPSTKLQQMRSVLLTGGSHPSLEAGSSKWGRVTWIQSVDPTLILGTLVSQPLYKDFR